MKYVIGVVASGSIVLFWAVICALVGFRNGGGVIGMSIMWMTVAGTWVAIIGYFNSVKNGVAGNNCESQKATLEPKGAVNNSISPESVSDIEANKHYAQAMVECEGTAREKDEGVWARAFALADGDNLKTKAMYIQLRASNLIEKDKQMLHAEHIRTVERRKQLAADRLAEVVRFW